MIHLDLFSGIGGFSKGLTDAGFNFNKTYFAEIDKYAIGTYKYNFQNKNIEHIGDVRNTISAVRETPDIITFGSPCQDFSIAGKRAGLEGARSSLLLTALDIVRTLRPAVFIWENVKGAFSSNGGRDFQEVLRTIADFNLYECEGQLVNTKWLLPQNRERIYLIGHLAEKRGSFGKVFPIRENAPNRIRKKEIFGIADFRYDEGLRIRESGLSPSLESKDYKEPKLVVNIADYRGDEDFRIREDNLRPTLQARAREDGSGQPMVVHNMLPRSSKTNKGGNGHLTKTDGATYCIDTGNVNAIEMNDSIRRLTPIECERLQGYPDDYTKYRIDEKGNTVENSDSQRYKMIGNSVTVDIVKLIGNGLLNK